MTDTPPEPPAPARRRLSGGAFAALAALTALALLEFCSLGFFALLMTEPPECFLQLTPAAEAQCEHARTRGWNLLPAAMMGGLALLPLAAAAAALVVRHRVAPRWVALAVICGCLALATLVPTEM